MNWLVRLYKAVLLAYPAAFRREYGPDMVRVFRDLSREVRLSSPRTGSKLFSGKEFHPCV